MAEVDIGYNNINNNLEKLSLGNCPEKIAIEKPNLTTEEESILEQFKLKLPNIINTDKEYHDDEAFCTEACLLRYLRATRWKLADAEKRLKSTLEWRRVYKPHMLKSSQFIEAGKKGHMITQGFDKFGRPIFIMRPGCQNSSDEKLKVQFMVYTLETAIKRCPEGIEQLCIIIDWRGSSTTNGFNLNAAYESTNILQNHYPGRMGITYSLDASWILSTFLKLMLPLIDPITQKKIKILNLKDQPSLPIEDQMISVIDKDVLYEEYGGTSKLSYDPNTYFQELAKFE